MPTFGVLAAVGLMLGLSLSLKTARLARLNEEAVWDAGLFAVIAAFVCSRLLLAITYFDSFRRFPVLLLAVPSLTPTGVLLAAFATAAWLYLHRLPMVRVLDAWAAPAALVWGFLALGHFAAGSDPGMPAARLGIAFPGESTPLHPVALYAAACGFGLAAALWMLLLRRVDASLAGPGLLAAGVAQFLLTFLRQPLSPSLAGLDPLEWIAVAMIVSGAWLLARRVPHHRP